MGLESLFRLSLIMNLVDNLTGPMARVQSSVEGTSSRLAGLQQTSGSLVKAGAAAMEAGQQILSGVTAPIEATFETRRAIGELASLGVEDLGLLENAARQFSDTWVGTTKADFITAAYDIKSGISSLSDAGIAGYTEVAGVTAKATKATIEEMTSLFATGYGIYKGYYSDLSDMEFGEIFSAGIAESVRAFKTSGSGMAQSIQSLGASATSANVPLEEQLAILGMLQATMGGSEAGTKYKAFLRSAVRGGEALGLSFTDANNQLLALPEILETLRGKFGDTIDAAEKMEIQKAFGDSESIQFIDLLYNKVDDLQGNILGLYSAMGEGIGVATQMASVINSTEPDKYERLLQTGENIKETFGNALLPTLNNVLDTVSVGAQRFGTWAEENQGLVKVLMLIVLGLGGFLTVGGSVLALVGGIGFAITQAAAGFKAFQAGLLLIKGGFLKAIPAAWGFASALLANPITWIVLGIVALVGGLILLYNKCEWFRNGVNAVLNFLKNTVGAAFSAVKGFFQNIGETISTTMQQAHADSVQTLTNMRAAYEEHGGGIRGTMAAAFEGIKGAFTTGFNALDNLSGGRLSALKDTFLEKFTGIINFLGSLGERFRESGRKLITTLGEGIKSAFLAPFNAVKDGLQRIRNLLPFSDAKEGPLSSLTLSGKRTMSTIAEGIDLAGDAPANAVERGFERISIGAPPPKSKSIRQAPEDDGSGRGGKSTIIQKLVLKVDLKSIKELPMLLRLVEELQDMANGDGFDDADPEEA
ncbi:phage tail tape measure protein [Oscillospiraceae bacterium OttesenSCG-928-F05]|nr:phage tail tape measure protein [Oscillospiraceae bacterium OttesenSCG-928-F05]